MLNDFQGDMEQGVLFVAFAKSDIWNLFLKRLQDLNIQHRELHLIDIHIPLQKDEYNARINWLKGFSSDIGDRLIQKLPFFVVGQIEKSMQYKFMKNKVHWEKDVQNPFLALNLTPLMSEFKEGYLERLKKSDWPDKEERIRNYLRLERFESDSYEPKPDILSGASVINTDDINQETFFWS